MCHMTLLSHLMAIQYLTLNPFQQPKSLFWLVYQQQEEQQEEQQQDAENPFLDPPFSRIKNLNLSTQNYHPSSFICHRCHFSSPSESVPLDHSVEPKALGHF
jgi:hypothetical protein